MMTSFEEDFKNPITSPPVLPPISSTSTAEFSPLSEHLGGTPSDGTIPGCPPGLEYLADVDELIINQHLEMMLDFYKLQMKNNYKIMNSMGQQIYSGVEDADFCARQCGRPFEMQIMDTSGQEVLHMSRPCNCHCACFCPWCLQKMEVSSPRTGIVLGYINEVKSFCVPKYFVENAANEVMFTIRGPFCACNGCSDIDFNIFSKDEVTHVGVIKKQWTGMFSKSSYFSVTFPPDLDACMKAVLLGAQMLINFMYFDPPHKAKSVTNQPL